MMLLLVVVGLCCCCCWRRRCYPRDTSLGGVGIETRVAVPDTRGHGGNGAGGMGPGCTARGYLLRL